MLGPGNIGNNSRANHKSVTHDQQRNLKSDTPNAEGGTDVTWRGYPGFGIKEGYMPGMIFCRSNIKIGNISYVW